MSFGHSGRQARSALQRYVIAFAERERAYQRADGASETMRAEQAEAMRALPPEGDLTVELLDGSRWRVFGVPGGVQGVEIVVDRA